MDWEQHEAQAGADLNRRLEAIGIDGPRPTFAALWSVLLAWAAQPTPPLDDRQKDEFDVIAAWHEPSPANDHFTYFDPPAELGQPLFAISFAREIYRMTGPASSGNEHYIGGLDVYFPDSPAWADGLADQDTYLGREDHVPAIEYFWPSDRLAELAERALIKVAWASPVLGFGTEGLVRSWPQPAARKG